MTELKRTFFIRNFHSHRQENSDTLFSLYLGGPHAIPQSAPFSVGVHPWFNPGVDWEKRFIELALLPNCCALGEMGLDNKKGLPMSEQLKLMERQLELSRDQPHRLYVIHCVGAFEKIEEHLKAILKLPKRPALLFHDYGGSLEFAQKMQMNGPCFFSFSGTRLERLLAGTEKKTLRAFKELPLSVLALETDDGDQTIEEVYELGEKLRGEKIPFNSAILDYLR